MALAECQLENAIIALGLLAYMSVVWPLSLDHGPISGTLAFNVFFPLVGVGFCLAIHIPTWSSLASECPCLTFGSVR